MSLTDELWAAFSEKGLVKDKGEFLEKYHELYEAHPEIVEEVTARRKAAKELPLAEELSPLPAEQK
jgi:hypothetical protein